MHLNRLFHSSIVGAIALIITVNCTIIIVEDAKGIDKDITKGCNEQEEKLFHFLLIIVSLFLFCLMNEMNKDVVVVMPINGNVNRRDQWIDFMTNNSFINLNQILWKNLIEQSCQLRFYFVSSFFIVFCFVSQCHFTTMTMHDFIFFSSSKSSRWELCRGVIVFDKFFTLFRSLIVGHQLRHRWKWTWTSFLLRIDDIFRLFHTFSRLVHRL